ncbi:MAG: hypothetical protein HS127_07780 [Planctomycetia bacterium]|nr:hypothetical protein [Planctomycetia bacterium]
MAFYDTIPHKLIMDSLREKIADGWVLNSIENMLKAGVMEDGIVHETNKGTPQGGVISLCLQTLSVTSSTRNLKRLDISLSDTPMISLS